MVSLAELQVPSSPSPCTSSTRIQRSNGRSMRTVRSKFYQSDHNYLLDPPAAACRSPSVSEILTDSFVDFHLGELAAAATVPSAAKSASQDAATAELLDLSHSFSDFSSSFNSDISGELQRLSFLTPQRESEEDRSPSDPETPLSTEFLDQSTPDTVYPIVNTCVESLGSSNSVETRRAAAARLRMLAKHRSDFRELITAAEAIPALVLLLKSTDPATQENAVTALLNLSLDEPNKEAIASAGAIKPLVYALRTGTSAAKQNAACALLSLSMAEENRATIGTCGAVPPLVDLLLQGSTRGKKDALTTLYRLCSARRNKERAVSAGAVGPLVLMAGERGGGTAEKAMVVMSSLAGIPEGRAAIVAEGGIPALVEAIEDGPPRGKEFAVVTLLQLCADSTRNRCLLVREGAIPPLVALSQSGSTRAKHKAETLLGYLREQRGVGAAVLVTRGGESCAAGAEERVSRCM